MPLAHDPLNGRCFISAQLQLHLRSGEGPHLNSTLSALTSYVFKKEKGRKGRGKEARSGVGGESCVTHSQTKRTILGCNNVRCNLLKGKE